MEKCEHIIGLWNNYENTYNITLNELKQEIKYNDSEYRQWLNKEYPGLCTKIYQIKDYADRRKSTNLDRYNYCPICGQKIDWKKIKGE